MKKKTIAKIQLIIGIVILIAGIVGLIYSTNEAKDTSLKYGGMLFDEKEEIRENCPECSEGEVNILWMQGYNIDWDLLSMKMILYFNLGAVSILSILLSLLFITQGLINMSREIK